MYPFAKLKNLRRERICDFCSSSFSTLVTNPQSVLWRRLKPMKTQKHKHVMLP